MSNDAESPLAAAVRQQLAALVGRQGPDVLDDSRRVRAMLADSVAGATAETNLIGLALSSGVPARLRDADRDPSSVSAVIEATVRDLERTSSVQPADARWAVSAIAAALGLSGSPAAGSPVAAETAVAPAAAPPAGIDPGADDLVVHVAGQQHRFSPGATISVGRDPESTITLDSPAISRRHGQVRRGADGWEYTDLGSTQGSYSGGVAVTRLAVRGDVTLVLGQAPDAVTLRLVSGGAPAAAPPRQRPAVAAPAPATELPGGVRPGGALGGGRAPATELAGGGVDGLTATLGSETRTVAPGGTIRIGREDDNDLVASHTTTSRNHVRIEHADGAWRLRDLNTTSGTWLDGQRVTESVLSGEQQFVLGDQQNGDRLVTKTATNSSGVTGGAAESGGSADRPGRSRLIGLVAAGVVLLLVLGLGAWRLFGSGGENGPLSNDELARATVYIVAGDFAGSGTIIDKDRGLILTNAHVVDPAALGQAVELEPFDLPGTFADEADPTPDTVTISVSDGLDESAEVRFQGKVIAADGYLDLAVVQITARPSGFPTKSGDLDNLVAVPLGDSAKVRTSDPVKIFGYPGSSGSDAPTYTDGKISGGYPDLRLKDPRAWFNTATSINHGNSGGLAADADGRLIAVPTIGDELNRLRPINLAKPLIKAAKAVADGKKGSGYATPWTKAAPIDAQAEKSDDCEGVCLGYGTLGDPGDVTAGCDEGSRSGEAFAVTVPFLGFPAGEHTDVFAELSNDQGVVAWSWAKFPAKLPRSGCMTITFNDLVPAGTYRLKVGVGGDLRVIVNERITLN
jgi:pSer/pThr/pTyr-binding forkhead associated (FHA) protein